ncbi:hypothetical protein TNCV_5050771 [Trichonephila clavipes]|nr:hypothetical protein TNCV_5050771 [Trichonephila clavipes]
MMESECTKSLKWPTAKYCKVLSWTISQTKPWKNVCVTAHNSVVNNNTTVDHLFKQRAVHGGQLSCLTLVGRSHGARRAGIMG